MHRKKKRATPGRCSPKVGLLKRGSYDSANKSRSTIFIARAYFELDDLTIYPEVDIPCSRASDWVASMLLHCLPHIFAGGQGHEKFETLSKRLKRAFDLMACGVLIEIVLPFHVADGKTVRLGYYRHATAVDGDVASVLTIKMLNDGLLEGISKPSEADMKRYRIAFGEEVPHV